MSVATSKTIPHLLRLSRRVNANASEEPLGMTIKQLALLASLRDGGELPQTVLCDLMRMTQNTVVVWLNELEDMGFVTRARDTEDRRKHNVALTPSGAAALERAEGEMRKLEDEALSGLTADEQHTL